jgi:excisionase family DNA binding protein
VRQACRRLKVSRVTLFRLIDEGELPAYRIGWMIRLRVVEVEAYRRRRADGE